ncbi:cystathionine gamma-synthase [Actinomadura craniellae]|uniref:homocysteine desulfhydrase n=1 Tax=Actinomadura craniellae TaxID=2231787 RepID=A0A365HA17_9ACTN|nr:aminotransferase class I/II-fold pyridoxal phosphate-dependent enzyme [Actinomadura craniellae]RAY15848.1 cystathionine gamma-synthase [Actinomadura craniellae]
MSLHPETRAVHPPIPQPAAGRPLSVPLYQGHLFGYTEADTLAEAFDGPGDAYFYSRMGNPTVRALEEAVADLEGGTGALSASSGMGVISAVLLGLLSAGDHLVIQHSLYGGTHALVRDLAERRGVEVTYVSGTDPGEVRAAVRPTTRMLYLETIANPSTQVADLPALIEAAGEGVLSVVDNTFATPLLCRPLEYGADISLHSATKYICGHADVLGGVAVFADPGVHRTVWNQFTELGPVTDPFAAWLLLRGLATLPLRIARHCSNAQELAERLAAHPAVERVHYPGLPGHPQHEVARRLLPDGAGGVLSFELTGGRDAGRAFIESVRLAALAVSLGDVKTLVMHPASTSHRMLDAEGLAAAGIGAGTVRVAVGIEHPGDLWADFEQALAAAKE